MMKVGFCQSLLESPVRIGQSKSAKCHVSGTKQSLAEPFRRQSFCRFIGESFRDLLSLLLRRSSFFGVGTISDFG